MKRILDRWFPVGTRSVLFGAHAFWLHPWFVAAAWTRLYGFPWDPRLWVAFYVHDLGYFGKPNMDGPEGERHVELGARIMHVLFDQNDSHRVVDIHDGNTLLQVSAGYKVIGKVYVIRVDNTWRDFCLYHSRFYARRDGQPFSRLCVADKLAVAMEPWWLYLPRVILSGEAREYMALSRSAALGRKSIPGSKYTGEVECTTADEVKGLGPYRAWFAVMSNYCRKWAMEHADGRQDTWTPAVRSEASQ